MNKLAEKVVPAMNETELEALIDDHYRGEAQTLTTGAEQNLLRLRELRGVLTAAEEERVAEIRSAFGRNQALGGDDTDPMVRAVAQLGTIADGIGQLGQRPPAPAPVVNVTVPTAEPPVVEVTVPVAEPPVVNVTLPAQEPPVVNVTVPTPEPAAPSRTEGHQAAPEHRPDPSLFGRRFFTAAAEDIEFYWEVGPDGWAVRQLEIDRASGRPLAAATLQEWRGEGHGGPIGSGSGAESFVEQALDPADPRVATRPISGAEFERRWAEARSQLS